MSTPLDRHYMLEQYEALRLQALEGNGTGTCGHGLALFLSRGMSAWTSALSALAHPASRVVKWKTPLLPSPSFP